MKFFLFFFNFIIFIKNEKVNYIFSIKTQDENNKIFLILNEFGIDKKYEMKKLNLTQISLNYLKYFFYTFSIDLNDSQTYAFSIINDKNAIIQRKKILTSKELQQIKYETNLKKKKKIISNTTSIHLTFAMKITSKFL